MEKLLKLKCDNREHDRDEPAYCKKFEVLTGHKAQFEVSACEYCKNNKNHLLEEPFRSKYHKLIREGIIKTTLEHADCMALGDPIIKKDMHIDEYTKIPNICNYYGSCTIHPNNIKSCQLCDQRINVEYLYNKNPDYEIYGETPKCGNVGKWAIGIITAPRKTQTIIKTVKSLEANSWKNITIFSEPDNTQEIPNFEYVKRSRKIGIFGNWMLGLYEMFIRNIDADAFMMLQDDIVLPPGSKNYLENSLWLQDGPHIVSLFAPHMVDSSTRHGWRSTLKYHGGPNAVIMSHETVQEVISSLLPLRYYGIKKKQGTTFDDLGIFVLMNQKNWPVYYQRPNIGDHIGHESTHCRQKPKWVHSDMTLCNHQYYDVEHWFVIKNKSEDLKKNLDEICGEYNLHIGEPSTIESTKEWIITTEIPENVRLLEDPRDAIIRKFNYEETSIAFPIGIINDKLMYVKDPPCNTICRMNNSNGNIDTIKRINRKAYWAYVTK